jgi:2-keto-3-deoxy-L-fuconate dehydrogenase
VPHNPARLAGKHAFVSAAAQGIGRAIALRLAEEGARVVAVDIDGENLTSLGSNFISTHRADILDRAAIAGVIDAMPAVDIVVNCVGWVAVGSILDCSAEDWDRSFRLNVDSVFHTTQMALPRMVQAGGGSIINIASLSGLKAVPDRAAYSATKAAIIGLTRSVSADFAKSGIRSNAICPAMVLTPSLQARIAQFPDPVAAHAAFVARHPVGRLGTAEDVAALAAYLASAESSFVTGSAISLDGGA